MSQPMTLPHFVDFDLVPADARFGTGGAVRWPG